MRANRLPDFRAAEVWRYESFERFRDFLQTAVSSEYQ
jgi:hypothetical protein